MTSKFRAYLLVVVQLALIVLLVLAPRMKSPWGPLSEPIGWLGICLVLTGVAIAMVAGFGLGKSFTASPIPSRHSQLKTFGIYSRVRHPIYFGLLLVGFGVTLDAGYWPQAVIVLFLYLVLKTKADFEETLLFEKYSEYRNYAARTPQLFPRIFK